MRVKVFYETSLASAMAKVRQELGADALILSRESTIMPDGSKGWCVHASVETEQEAAVSSQQINYPLFRLERLVDVLESRCDSRLREQLISLDEKRSFDTLVKTGMHPRLAVEFASLFSERREIKGPSLQWAKALTPKEHREVIAFMGPTGGGKTSLCCKLAAHFKAEGVSVGFLTTDLERFGGLSSMRYISEALNVECLPLRTKGDAEKAKKAMQDVQLLLIDTVGMSEHEASNKGLNDLLTILSCHRRLLVLPANLDEADAVAIFDRAQCFQATELAMTKLDDSVRLGKVVNFAAISRLPLSYCSFGPSVSDQVGWMSPSSLGDLLLKPVKNKMYRGNDDAR